MTDVSKELLPCPRCGGQGGTDGYDQSGEPTHSKETCAECGGTGTRAQPTTDVVERVARALYKHSNPPSSGFKAWHSLRDGMRNNFRRKAEAAIAALTNPPA